MILNSVNGETKGESTIALRYKCIGIVPQEMVTVEPRTGRG